MDDNKLDKQQKQNEVSQKTAHVAGKGAATYFGGSFGNKAYDLISKTKAGQANKNRVNETLQRTQGMNRAMEGLNKSNTSNDKNNGSNQENSNTINNSNNESNEIKQSNNLIDNSINDQNTEEKSSKSNNPFDKNKSDGSSSDNKENETSNAEITVSDRLFRYIKKNKRLFLSIIAGAGLFLILGLLVIIVVFGFGDAVINFFKNVGNGIIDFFTTNQHEAEANYYNTLQEVQSEINKDYDICIDVNLITAALMVDIEVENMLENGEEEVMDEYENPNYDPDSDDSENDKTITKKYKKMKKQIKLLANMQIINKQYELDDSSGSYCSNTKEEFPINSGSKDSSSYQLIAKHDKDDILAIFTSKTFEEQNNAYYIYKPPYDENGECSHSYAKKQLPKKVKEVSIGDLSTKEDSVFYWNLIYSFIPNYYKEYIPKDNPARDEAIKKIADEIYLLYEDMGPSQTCTVAYNGPSSLCPNGVTITNGGDVGTFSLEEYVAGVVGAELGGNHPIEAKKAQAVAARTYVLKYTNYCTKPIVDNSNAQNFTRDYSDFDRQAAAETAGEILVDSDGKIFLSEYDSWYCKESTTCVYTKLPYNESHTVTLSPEYLSRAIGGHGRGMSQWAAVDMAASGKNYREILSYFYSSGVEISLVLSPTVTDGGTIIRGPIDNYLASSNSSIDSMNQYIYTQVTKAGISTREGVVAAAVSLISGFYNQTGYKLPYELWPSGKYTGYGMDPNWGTNTGRSDYPVNGLDCSGFISWAIHNGGFSYTTLSAQGWGNAGNKRNWSKGTTDSNAKPGDLIYNAPQSDNGTTGHIRMIVEVTTEGYVVAEASSSKNGMRINTVPFTSTGNYYFVDMSDYYSTATKVTDYPM